MRLLRLISFHHSGTPSLAAAVAAHAVAGGRVLDLDHVGAEVAEDLAAQRPGEDRRDVEDPQSCQRGRRGGLVGQVVSLGGTLHRATLDLFIRRVNPPVGSILRFDRLVGDPALTGGWSEN